MISDRLTQEQKDAVLAYVEGDIHVCDDKSVRTYPEVVCSMCMGTATTRRDKYNHIEGMKEALEIIQYRHKFMKGYDGKMIKPKKAALSTFEEIEVFIGAEISRKSQEINLR